MTTEYVRPDADITRGGWTDQAGGTTTIYTTLDETSASDSDYVQSPSLSAGSGTGTIVTGTYTGPGYSFGSTTQSRLGQSIVSVGTTVNSVTVNIAISGSPSDWVQLKVYSDASGVPGTQIGMTSSTVVPVGGGALETFSFTTPVAVSVGVTYWLVLERAGSLSGSAYYAVGASSLVYTAGVVAIESSGSWSLAGGSNDIVLTVYQTVPGTNADLKARLLEGSTQIVEWTHSNISTTFVDAAQTLTSPQIAAISNFSNLYIELDDNAGSVYKFSLGDPSGALTAPVVVRYRYKKFLVTAGVGTANGVGTASASGVAVGIVSVAGTASGVGAASGVGSTAGGAAATTWNPADKNANVTLSNGDLTATGAASGYAGVRSVASITSGKVYWELHCDVRNTVAGQITQGIANASANSSNYLGSSAFSMGWTADGTIYVSSGSPGSAETWTAGDTLCFALDRTNNKLHVRKNGGNWNNNASHDPATNTGGFSISAITGAVYAACMLGNTASGDAFTANFGATSFAQTPPSGFGNLV